MIHGTARGEAAQTTINHLAIVATARKPIGGA